MHPTCHLTAWDAPLTQGPVDGGWRVAVVVDGQDHAKVHATRTEAERDYRACLESDRLLAQENRVGRAARTLAAPKMAA